MSATAEPEVKAAGALAYVALAFLPKALSDLAEAVRRTPYRAA